jgi:PAS domain S-box-containing protein
MSSLEFPPGGPAKVQRRAERTTRERVASLTEEVDSESSGTAGAAGKDFTEREQAEEALWESELRLHNLADNLPNAMVYQVIATPEGGRRFTYVGRGVERLNEVTVEEALADANRLYGQVLPEYQPLVREREEEALKNLGTLRVEVQSRLPSGRLRWFEYTSTPRYLANGQLVWDGVEVDVTERKQVEEELERRVAERTAELTAANLRLQSEIEERAQVQTLLQESEERYRSLYFDSRDAMMTASPEWGFLAANPATVKLFACQDEQDFTSHTPASLSPEYQPDGARSADKAQEMMRLALENGSHFFEWTHRRADGTDFPATVLLSRFEHRGTRLLTATVRDITERTRAEQALRESNEYLENLFNHANAPIIVWNPQLRITRFNRAFEVLTGRAADTVIGEPLDILFPPERVEHSMRLIKKTLAGERWETLEIEILHVDGTLRTVLWNSATIFESDGSTPVATIAQGQDITERKQAEEALRELQSLYQAVVEDQTEIICRLSPDGRQRFVNDTYCRFFGLRKEELLGQIWIPRAHPDDLERVQRELSLLCVTNPVVVIENRVFSGDGTVRWMQFVNRGFFDSGGILLEIQAVGRDITERKDAEEKLKESEEKYRTLIEDSIEGIGISKGNQIVFANRALLNIFGYDTLEELARNPLLDIIAPESREMIREKITPRELGQPPESLFELKILRKDGATRDVAVQTAEITIGNRRFTQSTFRDITEWKHSEAERRSLEAQVQHTQKLESLGVLAGGIAHDFNNILHLILGNAHHAQKFISEVSPARPFIDNVERSVNRAAALTRQMLAYSGKGRFLLQVLDLGEIVGEIAHLLQSSVSKKVTLQLHLAEDLPPIEADAIQIQQVAMNMMLNAAEALEKERGGLVTVSTSLLHCTEDYLRGSRALFNAPAGDYVCLEVSDTGCGMNKETQERLFDPFFTTKFTGRGLGMSAVLGIVRGHKGAILVESAPDRGSTIRALFPAAARPGPAAAEAAPEASITASRRTGTILFVDDEPDMLDLGALTLEQMGYTVLTAADGLDAVEIFTARSEDIDCVLLDLSMPRMDGVQTLVELRRIKPGIPVILASGYAEQELETRLAGHEVGALIEKPYDFSVLSAKLQMLIG